ncbi:MAG: hypothetical protein CVU64_11875 [Deltaproteobacteria bacterium HGW-Deltaproteobacteria-21]|nr:MAG: hypothetical protein CVU64_11875 [Deltaproteobacteria bacterium HGW-Deltaproteobacteria-21]
MKRILQIFFSLLLLLVLSGCPIMMPFMMSPMLADHWNSADPKVEAVVQDLIREGVAALAANRGTYDTIRLDNAKVSGKFIQEERFRTLLLKALSSAGEWKVVDGEKSSHQAPGAEHPGNKSGSIPAFLNAELYQAEDMFHVSLEIGDSGTAQVLWKAIFSRPVPEPSSSHSHLVGFPIPSSEKVSEA